MTIHKEGYRHIVVGLIVIILIVILFRQILPDPAPWHLYVYGGLALFFFWIMWFFRSPKRQVNQHSSSVISPADGKIVVIEEVTNPMIPGQAVRQVSVFMSPLNVHLNRYPVSGEVVSAVHYPGKYLVAWHPKSSSLNERTNTLIRTENNHFVLVSQVAGFLARRIVCYAAAGKKVSQGSEMGFIKFGSRVDIYMPLDYKVHVGLGDQVRGGLSMIASLPA